MLGLGARDPLSREPGAVLAVLMAARYWPGRFPDGWVTRDEDFGVYSRDLPKPRERDPRRRQTLKDLVRRGLRELDSVLPEGAIERIPIGRVSTTTDPRERSTRLRRPPTPDLERWFIRFGLERLDPEARRTLKEEAYSTQAAFGDFNAVVKEATVRHLLERGGRRALSEAARLASDALARASTRLDRRTFTYLLALIDLQTFPSSRSARALPTLRTLADEPGPLGTPRQHSLHVEILVSAAHALIGPKVVCSEEELAEARARLDSARILVSADDHATRGELLWLEGLIELREHDRLARAVQDSEKGALHRHKAQLATLSALNAWRLAGDWGRVREATWRLHHIPSGLYLAALGVGDPEDLILWLVALLRYETEDEETGLKKSAPEPYEVHELKIDLLDAFNKLPPEIGPDALPLPAAECFELVTSSLRSYRDDPFNGTPLSWFEYPDDVLPVEKASWFRDFEVREQAGRDQ